MEADVRPAMFPSSHAEVAFFAVSATEIFFVKIPDLIENSTVNVHAKAVPSGYIWRTPPDTLRQPGDSPWKSLSRTTNG
jgi:hypothetical protein